MKEKSFRIEIKNPCSQNWDAMPQVNGGLYCSQCTKVITDFTKMSDEELMRILSKKNASKTCGKFYQSQLDKVYLIQKAKPQRAYHSLRLVLAGLLTLPLPSGAQTQTKHIQNRMLVNADQKKPEPRTFAHTQTIKGKVINRNTKTGIRVIIKLYASNSNENLIATFFTDSTGHYELPLPDAVMSKFFRMVYSTENYQERTVVVDRDKAPAYLIVSLLKLVTVEIVQDVYYANYTTGGVAMMNEKYEVTGGIPRRNDHVIKLKYPIHKKIFDWIRGIFKKAK